MTEKEREAILREEEVLAGEALGIGRLPRMTGKEPLQTLTPGKVYLLYDVQSCYCSGNIVFVRGGSVYSCPMWVEDGAVRFSECPGDELQYMRSALRNLDPTMAIEDVQEQMEEWYTKLMCCGFEIISTKKPLSDIIGTPGTKE